jgi:hypothetical protein
MKFKWFIIGMVILSLSLFTGCMTGGVGGADFDMGKFFSNPIVIVAVLGLIIFMWKKDKK